MRLLYLAGSLKIADTNRPVSFCASNHDTECVVRNKLAKSSTETTLNRRGSRAHRHRQGSRHQGGSDPCEAPTQDCMLIACRKQRTSRTRQPRPPRGAKHRSRSHSSRRSCESRQSVSSSLSDCSPRKKRSHERDVRFGRPDVGVVLVVAARER